MWIFLVFLLSLNHLSTRTPYQGVAIVNSRIWIQSEVSSPRTCCENISEEPTEQYLCSSENQESGRLPFISQCSVEGILAILYALIVVPFVFNIHSANLIFEYSLC